MRKEMSFEELDKKVKNGELYFHHTAYHRDYLSNTNTNKNFNPIVEEYNGRFGKGYTVKFSCHWVSTSYHTVNYYIRNEVE